MNLTPKEAEAMAHRVVARHLQYHEHWLLWENYPELGEYAFERLDVAVNTAAMQAFSKSKAFDKVNYIDSVDLLERAQ